MNRRQRRAMKKQYGSAAVEKMQEIEETISNMSESCSVCEASFDKSDKTLIDLWHITIDEKGFRLTCPECWSKK